MLRRLCLRPVLRFVCVVSVLNLLSSGLPSFAKYSQEPPPTGSAPQSMVTSLPSPLTDALALYRKGNFDEAIEKYQAILKDKPKSSDAYAGLIRSYLKKKDVQQAEDTATRALQVADATPVHVALGELYFRQGKLVQWGDVSVLNAMPPAPGK